MYKPLIFSSLWSISLPLLLIPTPTWPVPGFILVLSTVSSAFILLYLDILSFKIGFHALWRLEPWRSEPLEGPDTLDVLLDLNDSIHIRNPGFRHLFVRLYVIFCVGSCSRSTCRHVDPFKRWPFLFLNLSEGFTSSTFVWFWTNFTYSFNSSFLCYIFVGC